MSASDPTLDIRRLGIDRVASVAGAAGSRALHTGYRTLLKGRLDVEICGACRFLGLPCRAPSFGEEGNKVVGTWKLVSYEVEVQATGQKGPVMGEKPTGYATFSPDGRVFFVLTGEARKPAKTDQERAELLSTLVAYSGTYSLEATSGRPVSK